MTRDGHNFERQAILEWIYQHGTCPLTRRPLKSSQLIPNHALENKISSWCGLQCIWEMEDDEERESLFAYYVHKQTVEQRRNQNTRIAKTLALQ